MFCELAVLRQRCIRMHVKVRRANVQVSIVSYTFMEGHNYPFYFSYYCHSSRVYQIVAVVSDSWPLPLVYFPSSELTAPFITYSVIPVFHSYLYLLYK